jgi:hypothetical protein
MDRGVSFASAMTRSGAEGVVSGEVLPDASAVGAHETIAWHPSGAHGNLQGVEGTL